MLQLQQVRSDRQRLKAGKCDEENAFQVPRLLPHIIYLLVRRLLPMVTKSRQSNANRYAIGKSFLAKSIPYLLFQARLLPH